MQNGKKWENTGFKNNQIGKSINLGKNRIRFYFLLCKTQK